MDFGQGYVDPNAKVTYSYPTKPKRAVEIATDGYTDSNSQSQSQSQDDSGTTKTCFSSTAGASNIYLSLKLKAKKKKLKIEEDPNSMDEDEVESTKNTEFGRDWNEEFQSLMEQMYADSAKELSRTKTVRRLCEEFAMLASQVGKVIISELFVDLSKKKIPPITERVGGVAGGSKYFYEGIFFKLPVDDFAIYDDEEGIMKSAGHELRGLKALIDCRIKGLHYPLMILVDYRGYRLLAESLLPLGKDSLVYGSADGGRTLHADNLEMNAKAELVAKMLNLQGEFIWNTAKTVKTYLNLSCDIEGHVGKDDRMYLVDFARLWPPTTPRSGVKGDFLVHQMRPEFVKSYKIPLCPDSFSGFGLENKSKHNEEARQATLHLEKEVIPNFAKKLDEFYLDSTNSTSMLDHNTTTTIEHLTAEMHRHGINFRYLGLLRTKITCNELRSFLLTEIVARVFKNIVRKEMRKLQKSEESAYVRILVDHMNDLFGASSGGPEFWKYDFSLLLDRRYPRSLTEEETLLVNSYESSGKFLDIQWCVLFLRLQTLLGFKCKKEITDAILQSYESNPREGALNYPAKNLFRYENIEELYPIVKHIHRIFFEEGTALSRMAITQSSDDLFAQAEEKYKESLQSKPNDYRSLSNWGLSLMMQAVYKLKETGQSDQVDKLFKLAEEKFTQALSIEPNDFKTLNKLGNCLATQSSRFSDATKRYAVLDAACRNYQRAFELNGEDFEILYNWGNALLEKAKVAFAENNPMYPTFLSVACEKYALACNIKPDSYEILRNWAVTLSKLARITLRETEADMLFQSSYDKYKAAAGLRPSDHEIYFNWANALYHQATMNYASAEQSRQLMLAAGEQYFHSTKLKPDYFQAMNNWARVLTYLISTEKTVSSEGFAVPEDSTLNNCVSQYVSALRSMEVIESTKLPMEFKVLVEFVRLHPQQPKTTQHIIMILRDLIKTQTTQEPVQRKRKSLHNEDEDEPMSLWNSSDSSSSPLRKSPNLLTQLSDRLVSVIQAENKVHEEHLKEDDFEFIEIIGGGKGSFATVYKAKRKLTNDERLYAVKILKKELVATTKQDIRHPYILELKHFFQDDKRAYFVYEYLPGNQIAQCAKDHRPIPEERARFYAAELITALEHLHANNMMYKTLSPPQVLVDRTGHIQLLQRLDLVEDKGLQLEDPATCEYIAPEILEGQEDSPAMDWWAFGILVYQMLTGKTPFSGSQMNDVVEKIMMCQVSYPETMHPDAKSFLELLLVSDPDIRLANVKNLKEHPFFSKINWKLLSERKQEPPYQPGSDKLYNVVFPDAEMSDTIVMPNFNASFTGFTFAMPNKSNK